MVIDFLNLNQKEQPVLVLRNLDGTAIQTLGFAFNIKGEFCYNEISTLSFDVPAFANGIATPHYDDIIGTRIVDLVGWGQFILVDPEIRKDGITEIKSCKAYSLEYELTYKQITLPESGYYLRHEDPDRSLMDIVKTYIPSWTISVDGDLRGAYRVFSENRVNVYNFLKSTVQKEYNCIIDFDTYSRTITVIPAGKDVSTKEVFLSTQNLAKNITITEDTENIFTVLDVNGADDVTIYRVNPTGENKIYNLDYYMNTSHFSQDVIDRWNAWKANFSEQQQPYYNLAISRLIKTGQIVIEGEKLRSLKDDRLTTKENEKLVLLAALAATADKNSDSYKETNNKLTSVKAEIEQIKNEIKSQAINIKKLEGEKESLTEQMKSINEKSKISAYFNEDQLLVLSRYFKEDSIEDSSFVLSQVDTFDNETVSNVLENLKIEVPEPTAESIDADALSANISMTKAITGKEIYTVVGGKLSSSNINANIVRLTIEHELATGKFTIAGYLNNGIIDKGEFDSGTIMISGTGSKITHNAQQHELTDLIYENGSSLSFQVTKGDLYFSRNKSEYEEFAICWDLYEYGTNCLNKLAFPSYTFKLSVANFLTLDAFRTFAIELQLGKKVYVEKAEDDILEPILTKVGIEFDDPSSLQLEFSDRYSASDSKFTLVDLLDKSISLGKTVDASKYSFNSFVSSGASNEIQRLMEDALDVAKNNILSSTGQAISWDETGMHFRKWNADRTGYEPHEIGIINNNIVFTDDNWDTAKMAIGYLQDADLNNGDPLWGIVAPNLVGKVIVGENLHIQTTSIDGEPLAFKVDGSGASLYNASFTLTDEDNNRQIILDPDLGFGIGKNSIVSEDGSAWNTANTNFWVDPNGDVHVKGTIAATELYIGDSENIINGDGKIGSSYLDLGNIQIDSSGNITWGSGNSPVRTLYGVKDYGKPSESYTSYPTSDTKTYTGWHKLLNISTDFYAVYTYDGGSTWTNAVRIQGVPTKALYARTKLDKPVAEKTYLESSDTDWHTSLDSENDYYVSYSYNDGATWDDPIQMHGFNGTNGTPGHTPTDAEIYNILTNYGALKGIFSTTNNAGQAGLYISANAIGADYIKADQLDIYGLTIYKKGQDGKETTTKTFEIDNFGNVTLSGNITWQPSNNPTKVLYAKTELQKPNAAYSTYPASDNETYTGWHQTFSAKDDFYVSYNYSGGDANGWTDAVKVQGSDANVTYDNVTNALLSGASTSTDQVKGLFYNAGNNTLSLNADFIKTGTLSSDRIGAKSITADHLDIDTINVSGSISFGAFKDDDKETIDTAIGNASTAISDVTALAQGTYEHAAGVTSTFITGRKIESPEICGDNISVLGGHFQVKDSAARTTYGHIGYATGKTTSNAEKIDTYGVALSYGAPNNIPIYTDLKEKSEDPSYVIVTSEGVRLQHKNSALYVVDSGCFVIHEGGEAQRIGTGSNVCVFG